MGGPRVGIASTDWSQSLTSMLGGAIPGGANYIRLQQWRRHVTFTTVNGTLVHHNDRGLGIVDEHGFIHHDLDAIILQRLMFKDVKALLRAERKRSRCPVIINDLDDWYWGLDPSNAAYKLSHPKHNPNENINHYKAILGLSDVITVSTPFLAERVTEWFGGTRIEQIENCVDVDSFVVRYHRTMKPIVDWVGSTAHRSRDLEELHGIFTDHYRLHHSGDVPGAPTFADALGAPVGRVTTKPMMAPGDYARHAFCFDIGLAPLSDIPFNHAKSWIKAIEYAAAGVPFIASARPEYVRLHEQFGIGRIATTHDEWVDHIHALYDHGTRTAEALRQRKAVQALDVGMMAEAWDKLIFSLL